MSDRETQAALRRWRETGTREDEAAYLLARLRAGELAHERLLLAAYLGHPAAGLALGSELGRLEQLEEWLAAQGHAERVDELEGWIRDWHVAEATLALGPLLSWPFGGPIQWGSDAEPESNEEPPAPFPPLVRWAHGLALWGPAIQIRAGWAAASACLPLVGEEVAPRAVELHERVAAWLECPCDEHQERVLAALVLGFPGEGSSSGSAAAAIAELAQSVQYAEARYVALTVGRAFSAAGRALAVDDSPEAGGAGVRASVAAELVPWALGMGALEWRHRADATPDQSG